MFTPTSLDILARAASEAFGPLVQGAENVKGKVRA